MKYKCPCCGLYTFNEPIGDTYDICAVCFWEDDGWQLENPDEAGGANKVSLNEARKNYKEFGACQSDMKKYVRSVNKEDKICADLNELIVQSRRINYPGMSIEVQLEVMCGDYFVLGNPDGFEYVYWSVNCDNLSNVLGKRENIVAIISESMSLAFVRSDFLEKFRKDTGNYNFVYIPLDNWTEENLKCDSPEKLPDEYKHIAWIDDDFMNDDTLDFDFEAFEKIDSGTDYLNPKHFSIYEIARRI